MIPLTCKKCKKTLRLRDDLAGRRIKCPGCGSTLSVPSLDDDENEDDAPAPKKEVTFTPTKPSRAQDHLDDDDDEDDDERDARRRPTKAGKPSALFLILGLILGLGGLVAMSAFIVFAKQANDRSNDKQESLDRLKAELEHAGNDLHKKNLNEEMGRVQTEIDEIQHNEVMRYVILAGVCGIAFVIGFAIRGYHHVAMKKWHADVHGTGKKRRRRDEEDDDEDLD